MAPNNLENVTMDPFVEVTLDLDDVKEILAAHMNSLMLLYFTDKTPLVISVQNWALIEFKDCHLWPILHVQLVGNNFFLVLF